MENEKIPFDVTYIKDGQSSTQRIDVERYAYLVLRSEDEPERLEVLEKSISAVKNDVISKAVELYGKDINGLEVEIRPNFHSLVEKETIIKDYFALIEAEYEDQPEELAAYREQAEKSIEYYKSQNAEFFPGTKEGKTKEAPNSIIKEAFRNIRDYCTIEMVEEAKKDIKKYIKNERTIRFDVHYKKDGKTIQESIHVQKFHDLRNPYPDFDEFNYNPEVYGQAALADNDRARLELIESVETQVLNKAQKIYGTLIGVEIDIRPNYNSLADDEKTIEECLDIAKASNPELSASKEELEKLRHEVEQSLIFQKNEYAYYFPGNDSVEFSRNPNPFQKPNAFLKVSIKDKIEAMKDTENVIIDANRNINHIIKGYELAQAVKGTPYVVSVSAEDFPGYQSTFTRVVGVNSKLGKDAAIKLLKQAALELIKENGIKTEEKSIIVKPLKDSRQHRELLRSIGANYKAPNRAMKQGAEIAM